MYNASKIKISQGLYLDRDYYIGEDVGAIVNASIGTASEEDSIDVELEKARIAVEAGASIITDHSIHRNVSEYHKLLRSQIHVPLGAVPLYELAIRNPEFTNQEALEIIEEYLLRGFNILTLHCTVLKPDIENCFSQKRIIPVTSKGGKLMMSRIKTTGLENPWYEEFEKVLQLFKQYGAVLSLGPTYRPASVADITMEEDDPYWIEISRMSKLTKMAIEAEVPIIVEGIGHVRIDLIPTIVKQSREKCGFVPYRILAVSTDIALGYDNISSAIASSIAVLNGANIVTAVTASEHIGLPSISDVELGVVSAKIAIHSAELCMNDVINMDRKMSIRRNRNMSCQGDAALAIYPKGAEKALIELKSGCGCTMCGELCALIKGSLGDSNSGR